MRNTEDSNEITGLLITAGVGLTPPGGESLDKTQLLDREATRSLRVMAAVAGLDRQLAERRWLAELAKFPNLKHTYPGLAELGRQAQLEIEKAPQLNPKKIRRAVSPSRAHRVAGQRRMRRGARQFKKSYFVPRKVWCWWLALWMGTVLITASITAFVTLYLAGVL